MPDKDQPPEAIWLNDQAITEHFDRVKARYESGMADDMEEVPQAPLEQNELTKGLTRG